MTRAKWKFHVWFSDAVVDSLGCEPRDSGEFEGLANGVPRMKLGLYFPRSLLDGERGTHLLSDHLMT